MINFRFRDISITSVVWQGFLNRFFNFLGFFNGRDYRWLSDKSLTQKFFVKNNSCTMKQKANIKNFKGLITIFDTEDGD